MESPLITALIILLFLSGLISIVLLITKTKNYRRRIEYLTNQIEELQSIKPLLKKLILIVCSDNKSELSYITLNKDDLEKVISIVSEREKRLSDQRDKLKHLEQILNRLYRIIFSNYESDFSYKSVNVEELEKAVSLLSERGKLVEKSYSHLSAIPYMAEIMADYSTHELDILAKRLQWGNSIERAKKVESLIELKRKTKEMLQESNTARYELAYLLQLFPVLGEYLDAEFSELPVLESEEIKESSYDKTRDYLSVDEYKKLSSIERNQLALDRYVASHNKTKWQIGRDYELYVAYMYRNKGFAVDTCGSYLGVNDLGRDLICTKNNSIWIVQCKYWSEIKTIHENHIAQLYGTVIAYCIENKKSLDEVKGILITNITLSDTAKKFAEYLGIRYKENIPLGDFPRIKCNVGHKEFGKVKIYHLPFDQQYDATIISDPEECYAFSVKEAEEKGFRRAYKWHGQ